MRVIDRLRWRWDTYQRDGGAERDARIGLWIMALTMVLTLVYRAMARL